MPKHILCADDSVTMQKVVAITFAHTDYQVLAARSADEALNLARQTRPDLVLADAVMPGRNGYDLCQAIKSDGQLRSVPVVIVCGNSQAYDEARGKQAGADGHLTKPWDTQVFVEKIGELLGRASTHGVAQPAGGANVPARAPTPTPPVPVAAAAPPGPAPRPTIHGMAGTGPAAPLRPPLSPGPTQSPVTPQLGTRPPTPAVATRPAAAVPPAGLPKPPIGLPRPPLIRGAPLVGGRPAAPGQPGAAMAARPVNAGPVAHQPMSPPAVARQPIAPQAHSVPSPGVITPGTPVRPVAPPTASTPAPRSANPRSATIMGMPALNLPPAGGGAPPPPAPAPVAPPPPVAARPAAPIPMSPPVTLPPPVAVRPAAPIAPPAPAPVAPPPAAAPLPGSDALARAAQRVAAAGMLATQQAAADRQAGGHDPRGVEYEAIAKLSREIIERIAWEVVPELAEIIIREHVERLKK